jgi:hypothetical protein
MVFDPEKNQPSVVCAKVPLDIQAMYIQRDGEPRLMLLASLSPLSEEQVG